MKNFKNSLCNLKFDYTATYFCIIFNFLFTLFLAVLSFSATFTNNATAYSYSTLKQIIYVIALVFILSLLYYRLRHKIKSLSSNSISIIISISIFLLFIIQTIALLEAYTPIGWDVEYVVSGALAPKNGDNQHFSTYFTQYPNNLFLTFLFKAVYSFSHHANVWLVCGFLNIISIDLSLLFVFHIVKEMLNDHYALCAYFISALTYGVFAWIIVPYSDTISLSLTTGALVLYLFKKKQTEKKRIWLCNIGLAVLFWINYMIKPTGIIIFIAIYLVEFIFAIIHHQTKQWFKPFIVSLTFIVVTFSLFTCAWKHFIKYQSYFTIAQNEAAPMEHFLMMGIDETDGRYGSWNEDDVKYTFSFKTTEEKKEADLIRYKEKLKKYGPLGYLKYTFNKVRWITSEGNFFWFAEGDFANDRELDASFFKNLWYPEGKYYAFYQYFTQAIWLTILALCALPIFTFIKDTKKQSDYWHTLIRTTITGILLFIIIFEGRSRYLILYLPYFCILATIGLHDIKKCLLSIR